MAEDIIKILEEVKCCFEKTSNQAQRELDKEFHEWIDGMKKDWDLFFKKEWKPITFLELVTWRNASMWRLMVEEHWDRLGKEFRKRFDCLEEAFGKHCASRVEDFERKAEKVLALQNEALINELHPFSLRLWHFDPKEYRRICESLISEYGLESHRYDLDDYFVFAAIIVDAVNKVYLCHAFDKIRIYDLVIPQNEKLSEKICETIPLSLPPLASLISRMEELNEGLSEMIREFLFATAKNIDQSYWKDICDNYYIQGANSVTEAIRKELL